VTTTDEGSSGGLDGLLGISIDEASPDRVMVSLLVRSDLLQPWGILHGGVHCAAIETAASVAGSVWLGDAGTVVGVNNSTNFLRPVRDGRLTYTATPIQRGRTTQLWLVEGRSEDGKLVAQGQVRLANLRSERGAGS
jgi:uncharacterized protein (TIGR00369 family)